jgi:glycosyltransferase involved in cell wall biosynthesis
MTVHDLIGFNVPGHFLSLKRRLLHMFILKMMRLSVDKYIAVSMNTKRDIVNFVKVPPEKISVIYEAVSEGFKPRKNSEISGTFLKKYNLKKNYILYVARIEHPLKNHVTLIKALRVLKNEKFEISCVFIGRLYRRYEIVLKMIDEMDLGDNISVIGYVGDEDCHLFYNAATLVVFPSLYEGFGFPVLEAYASGKPIICSNISSLPELACTEEMMFDPLNENEIATKIKMFLTNKELRDNQLAKQEEKLKKFNWVLTAKETLNEYQNCLNKRKFKARSYCE